MSTLRFVCRADKPDKLGKCPIELIYQISGQRKKIFTDYKVNSINWNIRQRKAVYVPLSKAKKLLPEIKDLDKAVLLESEVDRLNSDLAGIESTIADIEKRFELNSFVYNTDDVITAYKEKKSGKTTKTEHKEFIFNFIDQYITDHKATRAKGSLTVYSSVKRHLQEFQDKTKDKVRFIAVDYAFFQRFQNYLINQGKLNNTTIAKVLSTLKTLLGYARKHGITVNNGYKDFSIKKEKLEVIALTDAEFSKLLNKDFSSNKKNDKVRDIFCFACATGLRVSDLLQLKREHIKNNEITLVVKKTKEKLIVPLNGISATILDKYKDQLKPLPMISSQKLNVYIKDICKLAGIDEPIEIVRFKGPVRETTVYHKYDLIHIHTGRKTFVTLSLEKGMSAEEIMEITGHKDYSSFKRYANVTEKRKKVVMLKAWGEIPKLKVVHNG